MKRLLEAHKDTPRCPLCHAVFAREIIGSKLEHLKEMVRQARERFQAETEPKRKQALKEHGELIDLSIRQGAAEAFFCHFCRITIMTNDPCVGRWDEIYAQGEKMLCPACNHEMRGFFTSTGYAQFRCPVAKCQAKLETASPDRQLGDVKMLDKYGNEVVAPGIDRPIATPEAPAVGQVGGDGGDLSLPSVTDVRLPPTAGRA